jgi:hypothetical protein
MAGGGGGVKGGNGRQGVLPRPTAGESDPAISLGKRWGNTLPSLGNHPHKGSDQQC